MIFHSNITNTHKVTLANTKYGAHNLKKIWNCLIVRESTFKGWHPVLVLVCIRRSTETVFFLDIFDFRIKSRWACFSHHLHALITPTLYLGGGFNYILCNPYHSCKYKLNFKMQCSIIMKRKYTLLQQRIIHQKSLFLPNVQY